MNRGFTLLEVLLALGIVGLVMAALGPALVGTLRAQRQAQGILDPLAREEAAFAQLRDDLLAAPRPAGSLGLAFTANTGQAGRHRADVLAFPSCLLPPLDPRLAATPPGAGLAAVAWLARETGDGRGLEWVRTCRSGVLDITAAAPEEAVLLRGLARVSVEVLSGGSWTASFDSADQGACLPAAVRIGLAYLRNDGAAGPLRYLVIDLPQMALDPTQQAGSGS